MDDFLRYILSSAAWWIWLLLVAFAAAVVYIRQDSFLLTDLSYRFPIIGKLSRYSRDYSETRPGQWLNVEAALCHDYARHVSALSKSDFERNCEYMRKAYDHGRRPMPFGIFALITLLVILEALGFSYLLGSWMALESSANERMFLTGAIVLVLAAILVWVTHAAGHQLYRTRLLRSCFQQFQAQLIPRDAGPPSSGPRMYLSGIVSLREDQSIDQDMPSHVQCANRVVTRPDDLGTYTWVWLAVVLVVFIAVISTILRIETLHSTDLSGGSFMPAVFQTAAAPSGSGQAAEEAREWAALSSFGILSVIFVVTQLVGMGVGYRYGFAGKQSREAHSAIRGCADYDTYFSPIYNRMRIADLRLTTLHRLMEKRLPQEINWTRDFFDYVREERSKGATDLQDPSELTGARATPAKPNGAAHPGDPIKLQAHDAQDRDATPGGGAPTP
jgi:hypothetical protein